MAVTLYRGGNKIADCSVRQEGLSLNNGIAFSYDASGNQGSFNEMLNVEVDEQSLYLKSMGDGLGRCHFKSKVNRS